MKQTPGDTKVLLYDHTLAASEITNLSQRYLALSEHDTDMHITQSKPERAAQPEQEILEALRDAHKQVELLKRCFASRPPSEL